LNDWSDFALKLLKAGRWRAASADDYYLQWAQKQGDTPFAYTMPSAKTPRAPIAIVLAPRFFTDADLNAQAAIMIHEMGHWRAYNARGRSDEYDGYKTEFDAHRRLGLTDADGLTYFAMLDGVCQYVVPRDSSYAKDPEIAAYLKESAGQ
jgi:hypothetical protein